MYLSQVHVADDAVYFVNAPHETSAIYRRPLTTGIATTELGDAEIVGFAAPDTGVAEHEGTIAYIRARDHRLVLRAPDGTETVPAWGAAPDGPGSVLALTDEWLLVIDVATGQSSGVRLFDRGDGRIYSPVDLVDLPTGYVWAQVQQALVEDDRLLFEVAAMYDGGSTEFHGLYTVALGPDGPTGPVVELARAESELGDPFPYALFFPVAVDGTRLMWEQLSCPTAETCATTVEWFDDAPYTGTPQSATFDGLVYDVQGDVVVTGTSTDTSTSLSWVPLADPGSPIRTVDVGPLVYDITGSYIVHNRFGASPASFTDASGDAVTITSSTVPQLPFADVDWSAPFVLAVQWMVDEGITTGYPDGTFRNTASVTREAMAAFLRRTVGVDVPACTAPAFTDVSTGHPFCGDIAWLADTGITTGWPDGTFRPGEPVSREAMAAFLYRLAHDGADAPACTSAPFTDVTTGHPFCGEIAWLADTGVTTGWPDGTFRPSAQIERQAMAAFLHRFATADLVPER